MPSAAEIRRQIEQLPNVYIFWTKREINALPEIMLQGEELRGLTSGFFNGKTVLAVCTNQRVMFIDKGMFYGLKQSQIPLDRVQAIDGSYKIFFGAIRVWDGASAINLTTVLAKSIDPFIKATRLAIDEYKREFIRQSMGGMAAAAPVDPASQLEKLAKLLDSGHLTQQEFEQQKHKLLSGH